MKKPIIALLKDAIEYDIMLIEKNLQDNDAKKLFINFYHFLADLFALRENMNIKDTVSEKDYKTYEEPFRPLKDYYNRIKHNTGGDITRLNIFVYSKKYPYSYPYTYGPAFSNFGDFSKVCTNKKQIELFDRILKDKNVVSIIKQAKDKTFELIAKSI